MARNVSDSAPPFSGPLTDGTWADADAARAAAAAAEDEKAAEGAAAEEVDDAEDEEEDKDEGAAEEEEAAAGAAGAAVADGAADDEVGGVGAEGSGDGAVLVESSDADELSFGARAAAGPAAAGADGNCAACWCYENNKRFQNECHQLPQLRVKFASPKKNRPEHFLFELAGPLLSFEHVGPAWNSSAYFPWF